MKFTYSADKTPQAPKKTVIFGYTFIDGKATEVKEEAFIKKLSNMEHVGIVKVTNNKGTLQEVLQEVKLDKEENEFLDELTPNATKEHINNLVISKSGNELEEYINENKIKLTSKDKDDIEERPNYKRSVLAKYVREHLKKKINKENGIN